MGGIGGTLIHDHWARTVSFVPPQGIGIFALFYIIAQVIERVQEPIVPYLGWAKDPGEKDEKTEGKPAGCKNQLRAKADRDKAFVAELVTPESSSSQPLHDLISNISASKAEKQKPPGVR